ncbi:hypothetical protein [Aquimarina litoralis]|uniref:hypothetical protein n=1 Tax=Aquimarina litoralis TaxID=584605 RepID=UPI001C5609E1|nr:hypothetical protein [Aquimarina litoralis]MBW1294451.1 hypothetical protein [Aquimarina litoralis]
MKNSIQLKYIIKYVFLVVGLLLISASCEEDDPFNFEILPSHSDGIQNLDETGVDCGGSSGVACPSCSDGIQNQGEEGIDCGGPCTECISTPRADILNMGSSPYFYTFETNDGLAGRNLEPLDPASQGVTFNFGVADPAGGDEVVGQILRPENGPFGGFEDFKFQPQSAPINFSEYHRFTLDVYIPSSNDFSGTLEPTVELILHDNVDGNFWQRWTVIPITIDPSDFDQWITIRFDGENAAAADTGVLLPSSTTYDNMTLRFGGSAHTAPGEFFVRDFVVVDSFVAPGTPRADALAGSGLPYFYTFETGDASSGMNLIPNETSVQGVQPTYGVADPAGSENGVARIYRPENGPFGGFEDFKFQPQAEPIDFSVYNKFRVDVYIPSSNDFSGSLTPTVELILHDNVDGNFWQRWTFIEQTVTEFDTWVTLEFDGSNAAAIDTGILLPASTTYDNFTLRFGGSGHPDAGEFFVKDFVPFM